MAAPIHDEFRDKLVAYHLAYDAWLRKFVGCPARGTLKGDDSVQVVTCDSGMAVMDLKLWQKSREAAKVLYGLKDKDE